MSGLALEDGLSKRTSRGRIRAVDAVVLALVMLALWQAIGSWTNGVAVSPPLQTLVYLFDLLRTGMFWRFGSWQERRPVAAIDWLKVQWILPVSGWTVSGSDSI